MTSKRNQSGFLILMLVFVLAISSSLLAFYLKSVHSADMRAKASQAGQELRLYAFGVMRLISDQGPTATPGTYTGVAWLKSNSCATPGLIAGDGYLPCSFPEVNPYRDNYTTVITIGGGAVDAVTTIPWPMVDGVRSPAYAGDVAQAAAAALGPVSGTGATIDAAMLGWLTVASPRETFAAETIQATVSTNTSLDIFLRTDGSNKMKADLDMDNNDIVSVTNITGSGLITTQTMQVLGNLETNTADVLGTKVVDGRNVSLTTAGDANVGGQLKVTDGIDSAGGIAVGDPTVAGTSIIRFRQSAAANDQITLEASTTVSGGNIYQDLTVNNTNGKVDLIADNVYNETINRYMAQAVYNMTISKVGDIIPYPTCPSGMTAQIFTAIDGFSYKVADPIEYMDIIPIRQANGWYLDGKMVTTNYGEVTGSDIKADILVATKCT